MTKIFSVLALCVAAAVSAPCAHAADMTPQELAQKFCDLHKDGTVEAEKATMVLLTPSLKAAMEEGEKKSAEWQAAHPDEKPPLGDGVPFQSYTDVAPECVAGKVSADGTEVDIEYRFPDQPDANWTDRIRIATVDGKLLIDDVIYGVNDFQDSLRDSLATMFDPPELE
ncbi:MAG: hypothetical protein J0H34_22745 [Rhizobiales bacterium]|nr:hypothetical protein [Hyphomicrobiales bacterium]